MFKIAQPTADVPYPNTVLIPQFSTDAILRQALVPLDVMVQQNTQLVSLTQDDAGVTAVIEGPGGRFWPLRRTCCWTAMSKSVVR